MVDVEGAKAVIKVTGMPGKHVPPGVIGTLNDMVGAVSRVFDECRGVVGEERVAC